VRLVHVSALGLGESARSRFISRGVLAQLEQLTWPVGDATSRPLSPDAPRVDIAGKLRGLWA